MKLLSNGSDLLSSGMSHIAISVQLERRGRKVRDRGETVVGLGERVRGEGRTHVVFKDVVLRVEQEIQLSQVF